MSEEEGGMSRLGEHVARIAFDRYELLKALVDLQEVELLAEMRTDTMHEAIAKMNAREAISRVKKRLKGGEAP